MPAFNFLLRGWGWGFGGRAGALTPGPFPQNYLRLHRLPGQGHGFGGGGGPLQSRQVPGDVQGDHRFAQFQGDGRLGDGAVAAVHRDEGVGAVGDKHVPGVPQVGGDGIGEVGVGPAPVAVGQDPQADAPGILRPLGRRGHHPAQPAAQEHRPSAATSRPTSRARAAVSGLTSLPPITAR